MQYKQLLGMLSPIVTSLIFLIMAMDNIYRPYAYSMIFFQLILILPLMINSFYVSKLNFTKGEILVICGLLLLLLKDALILISGRGDFKGVFYSFFELFFCLSIVFLFKYVNSSKYLIRVFLYSFFLSCLAYALFKLGGQRFSSLNFYSGLMAPICLVLLYSNSRKKRTCFLLYSIALTFSFFLASRAALGILIIGLLLYPFQKSITRNYNITFLFLLFFVFLQYLIIIDNGYLINQILTYRPVIWEFYFNASKEYVLFGHGAIDEIATFSAAEAYSDYVQRGAAEAYGTQSMYLIYFFQSGLLGLVCLFLIIYMVLKTKSELCIPFATYCVIGLLETIKFGTVSVYGLPLTLFAIYCINSTPPNVQKIKSA